MDEDPKPLDTSISSTELLISDYKVVFLNIFSANEKVEFFYFNDLIINQIHQYFKNNVSFSGFVLT